MIKCLIILFIYLCPIFVFAHPGIGIKSDSKGNIFYTDLRNVYKIDNSGTSSIAVANAHTHELSIDRYDNLYGEHLWYEGDATKKWGHYIWKRSLDGIISKILDSTEGFLKDYSFLRDSADFLYLLSKSETSDGLVSFGKLSPSGMIEQLTSRQFQNISWQYVDPFGRLYFYDTDKLYMLDEDAKLHLLIDNISLLLNYKTKSSHPHSLMGLWTDNSGIYITSFTSKTVFKIDQQKRISIVYQSNNDWAPTGGTFDKGGNLWLLLYNSRNECKVEKIPVDNLHVISRTVQNTEKSNGTPNTSILIILLIALILLLFIAYRFLR